MRTAKILNFSVFFVIWKTVDVNLQYASRKFQKNKKASFFSMESVPIKRENEKRSNLLTVKLNVFRMEIGWYSKR